MSTNRIESLMRNSASTHNGWSKLSISNEVTEHFRHITIGNSVNCNEDGLICDHTIENKIKEIALQIHNSSDNENIYEDAKYIYELAVIYRFLSKRKKDSQWELHSEKLKETLKKLNLNSEKAYDIPYNESEIIPLIDSIKDLVTEIPESDDDK